MVDGVQLANHGLLTRWIPLGGLTIASLYLTRGFRSD